MSGCAGGYMPSVDTGPERRHTATLQNSDEGEMKLYKIDLIHKTWDWDASFQFQAPDARRARLWVLLKLVNPGSWLVVRARQVK